MRRALAIAAGGVVAVLAIVATGRGEHRIDAEVKPSASASAPLIRAAPPAEAASAQPKPHETREAFALLDEQAREDGYHECRLPDPVGLGPYAPYRDLGIGRVAIPQRGGHADDWQYDVLLHFHGHDAARKMIVPVARGVVFAGVDAGAGSGAYADLFEDAKRFDELLSDIERELRRHSGSEKARIRNLALSAWSAGYGAVNRILRTGGAERISAVILLDGLHAGWDLARQRDGTIRSVRGDWVRPVVRFAERATNGEALFVFTHSEIDPVKYPSTSLTARWLLHELSMERDASAVAPQPPGVRFAPTHRSHRGDAHVWGFGGTTEPAHCDHLRHLGTIVRDLLEPRWQTPSMDRNVPQTPKPPRFAPPKTEPRAVLRSADAPEAERPVETSGGKLTPFEDHVAPDTAPPAMDTGGLQPMPLAPNAQ